MDEEHTLLAVCVDGGIWRYRQLDRRLSAILERMKSSVLFFARSSGDPPIWTLRDESHSSVQGALERVGVQSALLGEDE
jgi:hypothetical protein